MQKTTTHRLVLVWAFLATLALGYQSLTTGLSEVRVAFAADQIETFSRLSNSTEELSEEELIERLRYVEGYYPSGSKLQPGSNLDDIVENARRNAIKELRRVALQIRQKTTQEAE